MSIYAPVLWVCAGLVFSGALGLGLVFYVASTGRFPWEDKHND